MHVVKLSDHRKGELLEAISNLQKLAESGRIVGLAFVVKVGEGDNRVGLAGEFRRHPEKALKAALMMQRHLADGGEPTLSGALR